MHNGEENCVKSRQYLRVTKKPHLTAPMIQKHSKHPAGLILSEDELLYAAYACNQYIDQLRLQPEYPGKPAEIQILLDLVAGYQKSWEVVTGKLVDLTIPDIHAVGDQKPLGYATALDFRLAWTTILQQEAIANDRDLHTRIIQPWEGEYVGGALFVYDYNALQALLQENGDILSQYSWPIRVDQFVAKVIFDIAPSDTDLYRLVAKAFGDLGNTN